MYKLVLSKCSDNIEDFERKVTEHIKVGYIPTGAPFIQNGYYIQAVYKV